ncbi:MAG: hypothetical protein JWP94_3264 [Mucilaginibacter sp.]|jgi:hypothetical protein|nr:hypothetical protein [Mucilaginibacter sp.]
MFIINKVTFKNVRYRLTWCLYVNCLYIVTVRIIIMETRLQFLFIYSYYQ